MTDDSPVSWSDATISVDGEEVGVLESVSVEPVEDYTNAIQAYVERQQQRLDYAVRGAIRAGYDGVDIHYPVVELDTIGDAPAIEPWTRPEPDGANGYRTERYTWDWFSDDELTAILRAENPMEVLQNDA